MKAICVYCGSSSGNMPKYLPLARQLGETLARQDLTLVYGGSQFGLMGEVAQGVLDTGGRAVGVLPEALKNREVAHPRLSELHIVKDMHERKAKMAELSDAFIALPGGFGTLEEVMEMITWNQLKFQAKPIGFLDVEGYFADLFCFMEKAGAEGFIQPEMVKALIRESDPGKMIQRITTEPWPTLSSWPKIPGNSKP